MSSKEYWEKREAENRKKNIKTEAEYTKELNAKYEYMLDQIRKEINGFYQKYARKEGISLAEAKKRVSKLDIEAYGRKAAKYVKEKNFSEQANEEMRLYNATMKINRLEMLKANIGIELVDGFNDMQQFFDEKLTERTLDEFERQAGILGDTINNNAKRAHAIVNASFNNATYSDRIWMYQDMMKSELSKLLQQGLIQGKGSRELARHLTKLFGVSKANAERLMVTELCRVQTEAARQSYIKNGFEEYTFLTANAMGPCDICKALDGKHFKVKDMMPGKNAPPMHPRCHCTTSPYEDEEEYEDWLDFLDKDGTTEEWNTFKEAQYYRGAEIDKNSKIETSYKDFACKASKAKSYDNLYVSDKLSLKPKQLQYVNSKVEKAKKIVGFKDGYENPRVIICDATELPTRAVAAYTAADNTLRLNVELSSKKGILGLPNDVACAKNKNSTYVHEMFHWKDAQEYINQHGTADGYLQSNREYCKIQVDKLIKEEYNVYEISEYAKQSLQDGLYDEVYTEYRTLQKLKR